MRKIGIKGFLTLMNGELVAGETAAAELLPTASPLSHVISTTITPDPENEFDPLVLDIGWTTTQRLIVLSVTFLWCLISYVFYLTSFFVEEKIRKPGNVYMACAGLADMLLLCGTSFTATFILFYWPNSTLEICHAVHFLGTFSTYCYSIFFALTGVETYLRICCSSRAYNAFLCINVGVVSVLVYTISAVFAYMDVYRRFDSDYCERKHHSAFLYGTVITTCFHIIPLLLSFGGLIPALSSIRKHARTSIEYRRSQQHSQDLSLTTANILVYLMYIVSWAPHVVVTHLFPAATNKVYYLTAWMGAFRAVLPWCLYIAIHSSFRKACAHIYQYFFCKSTLPAPRPYRYRRRTAPETSEASSPDEATTQLVMHSAVSATASPQRAGPSSGIKPSL